MKAHLRITLIYTIFGFFWITFSDQLVLLIVSRDQLDELTHFQTFKGIFYVLFTAFFLFLFIRRNQRELSAKIDALNELNQSLALRQQEISTLNQELSASEFRYAHLFQICPLPLWVFDLETLSIQEVNQIALETYGYTRAEMLHLSIKALRPESEVPQLMQTLEHFSINNEPHLIGVFKHQKKNGELMDVEIRSEGFMYKGKKAKLVLAKDITKMRSVERALKESYDAMVQLEDRERERFSAELHDGLAQNLISIKQFILLAKTAANDGLKMELIGMLEEIVNNTISECEQIIHNLRPKELYNGGLGNLLKRTCDRLAFAMGISIHFNMDDELENSLSIGDKFQFFRLIQENLNNSIKYASATQITIQIRLKKDHIEIEFCDNGIGIPENISNSESAFLSIKQRLHALDGSYELKSFPHQSTCFLYHIPIVTLDHTFR